MLTAYAHAQRSMRFSPHYCVTKGELAKSYFGPGETDSIRISTLRFYISEVQFLLESEVVYSMPTKYFLLDVEDAGSLQIPVPEEAPDTYDQIRMGLGIDSVTNASGAQGGALDPTNGMYWTWQSGYINFKLEGTSARCPTRKNTFQFHLGGYQHPFNLFQSLILDVNPTNEIVINVCFDELLSKIDFSYLHTVMSPSDQAVELSKVLPTIFHVAW